MSIIEAIIIGLVQGLSEFIPISSTAHMTIAGKLMNVIKDSNPEQWTAFIATVQLGTLAAVLVYFWKDIKDILLAFFNENLVKRSPLKDQSSNSKLGWYIIVGSIPIGVIGLTLKDFIRSSFTKDPFVIGMSLIVFALFLWLAEALYKETKNMKTMGWKETLTMGIGQVFALIPGASRSGTTITAGLFVGLNREAAARFSFLLSIPAILASGLLEFVHSTSYLTSDMYVTILVATVVAGISGYFSIAFLLNYLRKNTTKLFIYYRIILGAIVLFFFI
jgi:undecaprenyl-diphosphatase